MPSVKDFVKEVDRYAPFSLSDEYCEKYSAYDNSGFLFGRNREVKKAVASLDFSRSAVQRAINEGAQLLYTHHPAIFSKIASVTDEEGLGEKLLLCAEHGVSVVSSHLNLDCAKEGIDEFLARGVIKAAGGELKNKAIFEPLSWKGTGYGRGYEIPPVSAKKLLENLKKEFEAEKILFYGEEKTISRVASFCGAGADERNIARAKEFGADAICSSDFKHHLLSEAREAGLSVIVLTHYAAERYGFFRAAKKIFEKTGIPFVLHTDEEFL